MNREELMEIVQQELREAGIEAPEIDHPVPALCTEYHRKLEQAALGLYNRLGLIYKLKGPA